MHLLVAGASGFLGSQLVERLRGRGHEVTRLVRRPASGPDESTWDPYAGSCDRAAVAAADVVVNLAGSPTIGNPHSKKWARELRESRVVTTRVLADAVAEAEEPPAFLAGSAIAWYGDHGDEVLTEESDSRGDSLLTGVTREWQEATGPALEAGARVCILRTTPVMDLRGAPLRQLRLLFRLGLGGRIGNGAQYMPMISLRDWLGATVHLAEHPSIEGPVNLCCPETPTNAQFTSALARAVHRPALVPVPGAAVRLAAGPMAPEVLGSLNVRPAVLTSTGYEFEDRDVDAVLRTALA